MLEGLLDGGYLPSTVIRYGIRGQLQDRIKSIRSTSLEEAYQARFFPPLHSRSSLLLTAFKTKMQYIKSLRSRQIAINTSK